jgi:hypothetical protein
MTMDLTADLDAAKTIASFLTWTGNRRQKSSGLVNCRLFEARNTWFVPDCIKVGTANACGKGKKNCNAFKKRGGTDVRRVISCH